MFILTKKSGRSDTAVTIHGHTSDENVAKAWQHSGSDARVFEVDDHETTELSAEPLTASLLGNAAVKTSIGIKE